MESVSNTNSRKVALVVAVVVTLSFVVSGAQAGAWCIAGFLVGGVGTAVNAMRYMRKHLGQGDHAPE